mmetsp:Transcript_32630/g.92522  ORF Transcript_32630/g.92522 Transcript_32630/m.92522 type:complete len:216 (+) Transcript_32630:549-1196(+)
MSLLRILSSKVARKAPSLMPFCPGRSAFFIVPLIPDTVRMEAPSNFATSSSLLNIPPTKAVLRFVCIGVPTSLSFFTTLVAASSSSTTPVAAIRHPVTLFLSDCNARTPVLGGTSGPHSMARQCMCSGLYLSMRRRPLLSSMAKTGHDWKRRQPAENTSGSLFFRIFGNHRCLFRRSCMKPIPCSRAGTAPTSTGDSGRKLFMNSLGTALNCSLM